MRMQQSADWQRHKPIRGVTPVRVWLVSQSGRSKNAIGVGSGWLTPKSYHDLNGHIKSHFSASFVELIFRTFRYLHWDLIKFVILCGFLSFTFILLSQINRTEISISLKPHLQICRTKMQQMLPLKINGLVSNFKNDLNRK